MNDIIVKQDGSIYLDWDESLYDGKKIVDRMIKQWSEEEEGAPRREHETTCAEVMMKNKVENKKAYHETYTCGGGGCWG